MKKNAKKTEKENIDISDNENISFEQENQPDETPLPVQENSMADDLSVAQEQAEKYKDLYIRSQAEMENLRKRTQIDLEKRSKYAISAFALDLLTVADNLKRAMASIPEEKRTDMPEEIQNLAVGLDMTQKGLLDALEKNGIKPIESMGLIFNPNYHKVVSEVEDVTQPAGTIVQEWQTGYTIGGDRVLREAIVVVTKGGPVGTEPHQHIDTTA